MHSVRILATTPSMTALIARRESGTEGFPNGPLCFLWRQDGGILERTFLFVVANNSCCFSVILPISTSFVVCHCARSAQTTLLLWQLVFFTEAGAKTSAPRGPCSLSWK